MECSCVPSYYCTFEWKNWYQNTYSLMQNEDNINFIYDKRFSVLWWTFTYLFLFYMHWDNWWNLGDENFFFFNF